MIVFVLFGGGQEDGEFLVPSVLEPELQRARKRVDQLH